MTEYAAGYWTEHEVRVLELLSATATATEVRRFGAACNTCGWAGPAYGREDFEAAGRDAAAHRAATRAFVAVKPLQEPEVVYATSNTSYDMRGLVDIFASLHGALVANPGSWLMIVGADEDHWALEDGDVFVGSAMEIRRVVVRQDDDLERSS